MNQVKRFGEDPNQLSEVLQDYYVFALAYLDCKDDNDYQPKYNFREEIIIENKIKAKRLNTHNQLKKKGLSSI